VKNGKEAAERNDEVCDVVKIEEIYENGKKIV
jgi:hypothetical protein